MQFFSLYDEKPEEFLDETDIDNFLPQDFWHLPGPRTSSTCYQSLQNSLLNSSCSNFATLRHSSHIYSKKKLTYPKEISVFWWTVYSISLKGLLKRASVHKFQYRNAKLRFDLQSQNSISLLVTITMPLNIQIDSSVYRSNLETTSLAFLPSKNCTTRQSIFCYRNCQPWPSRNPWSLLEPILRCKQV